MSHKTLQLLVNNCERLITLKQIHAKAISLGLLRNHHQGLACNILNTYAKVGSFQDAHNLFYYHIHHPDIVSFTCLINLYLNSRLPGRALSVFSQLVGSGLSPDGHSALAALLACGHGRGLLSGRIVHGMILKLQLGLIPFVGNGLIDMYSRNGEVGMAELVFRHMENKDIGSWNSLLNGFVLCDGLESARLVFDGMPLRNSITWNAMISGYARSKHPMRAFELFKRMKAEAVESSAITIVAVLSACASTGALYHGQAIHGLLNKIDTDKNVTVNNALMDMYSKGGSLDLAVKVFNAMVKKDAYSWTTMICGYAIYGSGNRALEVFSNMLESRVDPNEVTFLSLLMACSHAGLFAEGLRLFKIMIKSYGFKPKIEHYGSVVDLFGRAGLLEEAKEFIESMPINPDAVIWRTLLSSCLVHGNLKLAEMAGTKILELDPDDDGVYMLLWNFNYASNRLQDALKRRTMMRDRKVKKQPGCSWVEVNGIVEEFFAEEKVHHVFGKIHSTLKGIARNLKLDSEVLYLELQ
ncbi:pentatricopeptide repeat-containing protein [Tripterygium wilfordii]|uniref:Pentatricopeptide repeat-containing protein n=1 Tax=Tripterygium wilfordii TaxID=458696 RepID=A0A7J7CIT5_TRIWF|nr:pentatricopeptide repeat-containing protein At2g29760, chloroplastic-like [Tripterygium wilfordii]KAF5733965.1 pentatricopeptide repeat-containing protein [Tripterygium wilfordii]